MVSDKFKKRFEKLQKENKTADIRITKRYIDEKEDTVAELSSFIVKYADKKDVNSTENIDIHENINNYKSIVIEFEVIKYTNNYPFKYNLIRIIDYDEYNNIRVGFIENKSFKRFKEDINHLENTIIFNNEIKFNTIVTSATVLKTEKYSKMDNFILYI